MLTLGSEERLPSYTGRMGARLQRQALNESLLRDVNERIATLDRRAEGGWADGVAARFEFRCECGALPSCDGSVALTLLEYERVRSEADRFVVVPGHETAELERAVERTERFVIVDKLDAYEPLAGVDSSPGDR